MNRRLTVTFGPNTTRRWAAEREDEFMFEGDFKIELEDLDQFVQVTFGRRPGEGLRYTYRDPSGKLQVGDFVLVARSELAWVVKLGRGGYQGPVKDITTRLKPEELVP